ncbi:MAG: FAD-dependent oxidoreductase [Elainella sp. C42_A2020_010]|nr:FAD-dependent oxidoreductase [Elainella sp. C42_A2020_010]RNJ69189.1 MAG: FAD-dependent oxidoreductase [Leptolyngbya sp. IPPAS B-1204]
MSATLLSEGAKTLDMQAIDSLVNRMSGRPQLSPLPQPKEDWQCEVVVVGGTLGGISAASQAMQAGAQTCLIELAPWLGGQISSQGVSAIDESAAMQAAQNFGQSWKDFKQLIRDQKVTLPAWTGIQSSQSVSSLNSCWVGALCFLPEAGATASEQLLEMSAQHSPNSRWQASTAFKGAEFDPTGRQITAVYAVQRIPRQADYVPLGRPSQEFPSWYSWSSDDQFEKVPIRLQAPPGKSMLVIDATDTGELIGWAGIPYRLGSEARTTTSESFASKQDNPDCTQAFTYPFAMAILDDQGSSLADLKQLQPDYSRAEHRQDYDLQGFPMFKGASVFNYRRIVSTKSSDPREDTPAFGDITMINWNRGNDWTVMNPPLVLNEKQITASGQHANWMGGLSLSALRHAEEHALLFAEWLMETQSSPQLPLAYLSGKYMPMATNSGLSMMPYIREGRRIIGRSAYGQHEFMMREADLRRDMRGSRDFTPTVVALTHYSIDMHGCRYRNWQESWEASSAPVRDESLIKPIYIPLEALIPQGVDNLLIGGKSIAASHIVNGSTRVHYGEWVIGGAAGATAGWLVAQQPGRLPVDISQQQLVPQLQSHLRRQGLRLEW